MTDREKSFNQRATPSLGGYGTGSLGLCDEGDEEEYSSVCPGMSMSMTKSAAGGQGEPYMMRPVPKVANIQGKLLRKPDDVLGDVRRNCDGSESVVEDILVERRWWRDLC
jgi:hypothetical protein